MKKSQALAYALLAGCALPAAVMADDEGPFAGTYGQVNITPKWSLKGGQHNPNRLPQHFGRRAEVVAYDRTDALCGPANTSGGFGGGILSYARNHALEDVTLDPAAFAGRTNVLVTEMKWSTLWFAPATTSTNVDFLFQFWRTGSFTANPMVAPADVFDGIYFGAGNPGTFGVPVALVYTADLTGLSSGGLVTPTSSFFVEQFHFKTAADSGTNGALSTLWENQTNAAGQSGVRIGTVQVTSAPTVGNTADGLGVDVDNDFIFEGSAAPVTVNLPGGAQPLQATENQNCFQVPFAWNTGTGGNCTANLFNLDLALHFKAADYSTAPPASTNLGCLAAGPSSPGAAQNQALVAGATRWFKICLNADAQDDVYGFMDADSEGSGAGVSMGLFYENGFPAGALVGGASTGIDDGSGSGANSQLTYGVGRRASAGGDGKQYDGRSGELYAGTYYLGVSGTGALWDPATAFSGGGALGGAAAADYDLHFNTGTGVSSVEPPLVQDFGTLSDLPAGNQGNVGQTGPNGFVWSKFILPGSVSDGCQAYLDIDLSDTTVGADTIITIWDVSGRALFLQDDRGGATSPLTSQMSFGLAGARGPYAAGNQGPTFNGGPGLKQGTYYISTGEFNYGYAPNFDLWHVRSAGNGTDIAVVTDLYTNGDVTGAGGCVADFDDGSASGNPDCAVDISDLLYYLSLFDAGDIAADLDDGSGTGTPDGGVDISDLLYYLFRFDSGC